jgi:hypothetical protein
MQTLTVEKRENLQIGGRMVVLAKTFALDIPNFKYMILF